MASKLHLTLEEYGRSPAGKGNVMGSQLLAENYKQRFEKVMLRVNGKIDHNFYTDGDNYFILLRVPSEVVPNFTYEVVFKFIPRSGDAKHAKDLKNYEVRFFSNDPAFTFTYAHTYIEYGLLVEELENKLSTEVIKQKPKERNPFGVVNFAKILYFGFLYIKQHGYLEKHYYEASNLKINRKDDFLKLVTKSDIKAIEREEAESHLRKVDPMFKHRLERKRNDSGGNIKQTKTTKAIKRTATTQSKQKKSDNIRVTRTTKTTKRK